MIWFHISILENSDGESRSSSWSTSWHYLRIVEPLLHIQERNVSSKKTARTTMGTAVYVLVVNKTIRVAASSATNIDAKPYVAFHYCTTTLQCIPRCYQLAVTSGAVEDTSSARIFSGGPCQLTQLRGAILGPYCWESTSFVISFSSLMFTVWEPTTCVLHGIVHVREKLLWVQSYKKNTINTLLKTFKSWNSYNLLHFKLVF